MAVVDWASPVLSFIGAGVGAVLVYSRGRKDQWGRRFESALVLLADGDVRKRAMGRARLTEVARDGATGKTGRAEALAVLREDIRLECADDMWRRLSVPGDAPRVTLDESRKPGIYEDEVVVSSEMVQSAEAYVLLVGGLDAAKEQVALVAGALRPDLQGFQNLDSSAIGVDAPMRALPFDRKLILVKLSPEAAELDDADLRERARRSWRLSLDRVKSESPVGLAAVVRQEVIGAWRIQGVEASPEWQGRVEFELGVGMPELVGCEYADTGQNPVRYWP